MGYEKSALLGRFFATDKTETGGRLSCPELARRGESPAEFFNGG